jgi:hypothetical protein
VTLACGGRVRYGRLVRALVPVRTAIIALILGSGALSSCAGSSPPSHAESIRQVRAATTNFLGRTSGACDFVTHAFLVRRFNGSLSDCRSTLDGGAATRVAGPHSTSVSGAHATDEVVSTSGDHFTAKLTDSDGEWLVDHLADDTIDAEAAGDIYLQTGGAAVCTLITPRLKAAKYGGGACRRSRAGYRPNIKNFVNKVALDHATADSSRATEKLKFGRTRITLRLVKTGSAWLINGYRVSK